MPKLYLPNSQLFGPEKLPLDPLELILQILHSPDFSRVSQVETLTEFKKCGSNQNNKRNLSDFNICGEQFQAIYNQPGQNLISFPIKTEKSKLILRKTNDD